MTGARAGKARQDVIRHTIAHDALWERMEYRERKLMAMRLLAAVIEGHAEDSDLHHLLRLTIEREGGQ